MHLISHGIGKFFYELITVDKTGKDTFYYTNGDKKKITANYPFYINKDQLQLIGAAITNSRNKIPTSFQGSFDNIFAKTEGTRAVDWLDFLLYVVPTLVVPFLKNDSSLRKAVLSLVRGCALAMQWNLTQRTVLEMRM